MLSSLTEALDRRFLLNAGLPSVLFVLAVAFVWLAGADPARAAARLDRAGTAQLVALVAAAGLVAVLCSAANPQVLRLFEGYWRTPAGRLLAGCGRRNHQRRLAGLARDPDGYRAIHLRYPLPTQPAEVMPTRFGNILRSAELYPTDRYGIDTAVTWPRLYQVLPERQVRQVAAARGTVDLLVTTSLLAALLALVGGGYLVATGAVWWRFLLCFWVAAAVAWLCYLGALAAATSYGQLIRTAFDVHRGELLTQLHLVEEPGLWRRLAQHWYRGIPVHAELEPDEVVAPTEERGPACALGYLGLALVALAGLGGAVGLAATG
jgi:hypothetical protein